MGKVRQEKEIRLWYAHPLPTHPSLHLHMPSSPGGTVGPRMNLWVYPLLLHSPLLQHTTVAFGFPGILGWQDSQGCAPPKRASRTLNRASRIPGLGLSVPLLLSERKGLRRAGPNWTWCDRAQPRKRREQLGFCLYFWGGRVILPLHSPAPPRTWFSSCCIDRKLGTTPW